MTQITNQGEIFYRMRYLGGDTPAHHIGGNRFRGLIEDELYEVYLIRTTKDFPPYWMLTVSVPEEGGVTIHYWHIEDFAQEWEDV